MTLSNMRTPSYIGEVLCTDIETGNLPPYIHGMRIVPQDMSEIWAFEVDVEYSGGAILDIETRIEVHELYLQNDISNSEEVSPDLLEGFEYFGKQLNLSEGGNDASEEKGESNHKLGQYKKSSLGVSCCLLSEGTLVLNFIDFFFFPLRVLLLGKSGIDALKKLEGSFLMGQQLVLTPHKHA